MLHYIYELCILSFSGNTEKRQYLPGGPLNLLLTQQGMVTEGSFTGPWLLNFIMKQMKHHE